MSEAKIYRPRPISGFPEWLPEQRLAELKWIDHIRRVFESYGFCSIETPSVEELVVLLAKGETDNEIYTLNRLQADNDDSAEARLALHYDLTVPLARYVAQHFAALDFPFKRYQIQRVWRGERPQEGRYREFYQCDIDAINVDHLPLYFDAEMPAIISDVLKSLNIGEFQIRMNNRKILQGYLNGLGVENTIPAIRIIDKLDKIGVGGVVEALQTEIGLPDKIAEKCVAIGEIQSEGSGFVEQVHRLDVRSNLLEEGIQELIAVMDAFKNITGTSMVADLSIARGFDYYTGAVYETTLLDFPDLGSICSGGRYDNLAGAFINRKLPGVGISLGFSRLFGKLVAEGRIQTGQKCPTDVLVVFPSEEQREETFLTAKRLRQRGFNVEMYHSPGKISRQLRYASRKGIRYVWFPPFEAGGKHEVKDMVDGTQVGADVETWGKATN